MFHLAECWAQLTVTTVTTVTTFVAHRLDGPHHGVQQGTLMNLQGKVQICDDFKHWMIQWYGKQLKIFKNVGNKKQNIQFLISCQSWHVNCFDADQPGSCGWTRQCLLLHDHLYPTNWTKHEDLHLWHTTNDMRQVNLTWMNPMLSDCWEKALLFGILNFSHALRRSERLK